MTIIEECNTIQERILVQLIEINNTGSPQLKDKVSASLTKMEKDIAEVMTPQWIMMEISKEHRRKLMEKEKKK